MTFRLETAQVQRIYDRKVGVGPLIDFGKLDGAVNAPFQEVFGHEVHPSLVQKAAKLIDGISRAQAYQDGNKRLAWLSGTALLEVNGLYFIDMPAQEAADFVLDLDGSDSGLKVAALWISERTITLA